MQGIFVAGLRCGENKQVVALLVLDQGLVQIGFTLDHIDQVVHDAALATHDQVQVAQTHIEINDCGFVATQCQAGGKTRTRRGFADPAFS